MFNLEHLKMFSNRPALSVAEENTYASLSRAEHEAETRSVQFPWGTDKLQDQHLVYSTVSSKQHLLHGLQNIVFDSNVENWMLQETKSLWFIFDVIRIVTF